MNYRIKQEFDRPALLNDAIQILYQEYIDFEQTLGYEADWPVTDSDRVLSYSYRGDLGNIVPILVFDDQSYFRVGYQDYYMYVGTDTIDDTVCDKWQKVEPTPPPEYSSSTHIGLGTAVTAFIYTNIVVEEGIPRNYLCTDSALALIGSITDTQVHSGCFHLYRIPPYDYDNWTQEAPQFVTELPFTTDQNSTAENVVYIPDLSSIHINISYSAWSRFFEEGELYYISAELTNDSTSWVIQSDVIEGCSARPLIDLYLSDDLILTGRALTNGLEEVYPDMELDITFCKDGQNKFIIYFEDTISDFSTLNSYLSSGLDLKQLPEDFGESLDITDSSTYQVYIQLYSFDEDVENPIIESNTVTYYKTRYFNNSKLNGLWNRLVNAINILSTSEDQGEKSWQLTARTDGNYLYIEDGYLKVKGDPWTVTGPDETYSLYPDSPVELSLLNTDYSYNVYSPVYMGGATLIYADSSDIWGPVTFDGSNMKDNIWLNKEYNVLETIDAIEYTIYSSDGNAVKSGSGYYDHAYPDSGTTPLTDLPNGKYVVRITGYGSTGDSSLIGLEGTLTIGNQIANEGTIAWVHDKLITHTKLTRSNKPSRPADYMRGIAVCARYLNNVTDYLDGETDLETIVTYIEEASVPPLTVNIVPRAIASTQTMQLRISSDLERGKTGYYKVEIYDDTADTRLVASKTITNSTGNCAVGDIRTIYDAFNLNGHYRVKVTVTGPDNLWGSAETDFVWNYNTPASGGNTGAWPTPVIDYDSIEERIYVSNYTNAYYNCIVEVGYYDDQVFIVTETFDSESIDNGLTSNPYIGSNDHTAARLAVRIRGGSTLTNYSNIVELPVPCNSCGSYETEYDSSLDLWLCSDCRPYWRLCDFCGTPNDYNAWIDNLPEGEAYICEDCETNGVGFCVDCNQLDSLNDVGYCSMCEPNYYAYMCDVCSEAFDNEEDYNWHIEERNNAGVCQCKSCPLLFTTKEAYENHTCW
jgi:hypothetical protein